MSAALHPDAATLLACHMALRSPAERDGFVREMLAHSAAALQVIHGPKAAAEAVYSLADCMVCREGAA
jgi:hypothetical protein